MTAGSFVTPRPPGLNAQILRLAVPALGALLAEPTFLLVDAAIVGHLGTEQLAGVGIASVILGTLVGLSVFLAYGTTAQVARSLGAGQPDRALSFGIAGLYLAVIIGVAVLLVGWPLAPAVDRLVRRRAGGVRLRHHLPALVAARDAGDARRAGHHRGAARAAGHPHPAARRRRRRGRQRRAEPAAGQRVSPRRRRLGDRHGDHPDRDGAGAGGGRGPLGAGGTGHRWPRTPGTSAAPAGPVCRCSSGP